MTETVIDICKELGQNFIDFSYEANSCRAFADARDGLKPGQRACIWLMYDSGYGSTKPHVKSAKISGAVTGTLWPHGDQAIYDTFTRMSQDWINNMPEVDWHGNNGSQIIPDAAAAARYTEARLAKIVEDGMLYGIKKHNVNFIPNYSEDEEWPEVLPAVFPRLLVNGCQGIGSTIANVWLPNNFLEVGEVLKTYLLTGELDYSSLYPDFPVGCEIINQSDVHSIYETGKGKVILRARAEIKGNHIFFKEVPYQVYVEPLLDDIKNMITAGELKGIDNVYNRSSKSGILIDIECEDAAAAVLSQLYAKTDLQKSYSANQWALVGKTPRLLNLHDFCEIYAQHNISCVVREHQYDLDKAKGRLHIVDGLLIALEDIDNVISLIKNSENASDAKVKLMSKYGLTEVQAKAILDMKIAKLAKLEAMELQTERKELVDTINKLNVILNSKDEQVRIIIDRLNNLMDKYGKPRKTAVTQIKRAPVVEIVPEDVVVTITQSGIIKRTLSSNYKRSSRGTKGVKTGDSVVTLTASTNTTDSLLLFSSAGKVYKLKVNDIPADKGAICNTLIGAADNEKICAIAPVGDHDEFKYVFFVTKGGVVKKTKLSEYDKIKRGSGIIATKFKEGDSLAAVTFLNEEEVILITARGQSIHIETKSINPIGKYAVGVKGFAPLKDDSVVAVLPIKNPNDFVALVTSKGICKKVAVEEFPYQGRGGKGVECYKIQEQTGPIIGAEIVGESDILVLCGRPNSITLSAKEIPTLSRPAVGSMAIKGSIVQSVVKL